MPAGITDKGIVDEEGNSIPTKVTRIRLVVRDGSDNTLGGLEVEDKRGVVTGVDPETGLSTIDAEKIEVIEPERQGGFSGRFLRRSKEH